MTIKTYVLRFREVPAERGKKKYKVVTESGHRCYTQFETWKGQRVVIEFYSDGKVKSREWYI